MSSSKNFIFQMGLNWSFRGQVIIASRVSQIVQAIDNSIDIFKVSSERLIDDLGIQPNASDDQLSFAQNIDDTYKAEAVKALSLSKELGYQDFEQDIFNQVLQRKLSIDELKDWSVKLSGIKGEISKYTNIGTVKNALVGLSVKWLKSGEASLQDLGSVYSAISHSIEPFEESTKELVNSLDQTLLNNRDALRFSESITAEYKQLAITIRDISKTTESESWGKAFFNSILQKRPSIEQLRAWNEMWSAALAFTQREKVRTQHESGSTNEWNRESVINIAIRESWATTEFTSLEAIAELAPAMNTCAQYKGYSSLAECVGMGLFSKQKQKFLDPSFGGRYVGLSKDFTGYLNQLSGFYWTSLRSTLVGEFFDSFRGPIWSRCDQGAFTQKASALRQQVNVIAQETDQFKKWDLENQIKETIRNCP